jgi:hypothetical protein
VSTGESVADVDRDVTDLARLLAEREHKLIMSFMDHVAGCDKGWSAEVANLRADLDVCGARIAELEEREGQHLAHIKAGRKAVAAWVADRHKLGVDFLADTAHYDVESPAVTVRRMPAIPAEDVRRILADAGLADVDVTVGGHDFEVRTTPVRGIDSGRMRWAVRCKTCDVDVHTGTTGPAHMIRGHLLDVEGGEG